MLCSASPAAPLLLASLALMAAGCNDAPSVDTPPARFAFDEVAAAAGLDIPLTCGGTPGVKPTILEVNGNGVALSDLDGDGDLDVVLVDGSTRDDLLAGRHVSHHVLLNDGVTDGIPRFTSIGDAGLAMPGWPTGITAGDVDGDGRVDLVIGGLGADALFLNRTVAGGQPTFERLPLPGRRSPRDWTASLALADADGDGRLDLYITRYLDIDPANPPLNDIDGLPCRFAGQPVMCGPHGMTPQPDVFLRGIEGPPWFVDATAEAQLDQSPPSFGLGVLFADLDADGHPDLYVANDSVDNFVLRNRGDGRFESLGSLSGASSDMAGRAQAGMGVSSGDIDGDGDFDLAVTNFSAEANALYRNDGDWLFRDVSAPAGSGHPSRPRLGWGVHLADFDGDGNVDQFFANGHVYPEADLAESGTSYAQPLMLLPGRGDGSFDPDAFPAHEPLVGRAAARGDLDGDGDLDLVVLTLDGPPRLYLNRHDRPERHMLVTLRDTFPHAGDGFGAILDVTSGTGRQVRQKLSASGFQTSNDPRLHLAGHGPVLKASVLWPGGEREHLDPSSLAFGRHVLIERGKGVVKHSALERSR